MVDFGGWEMPVSYTSLSQEHLAVRGKAGLFDISHMGQVMVRGAKALDFLQQASSNDAAALTPGRMQYSLLPAEDGGLLDDIIVSRLDDAYFVVVNASNAESDLVWMKKLAAPFGVDVEFQEGAAMFALQGPMSDAILQPLTPLKLEELKYYHLARCQVAGAEAILSRSGYTGEDGFEICLKGGDALKVWEALIATGVEPIGLGARNTLRLEAAYPLYGHEISRETKPAEAGLNWVVKPAKGPFSGSAAMAAFTPARRLAGFEMVDRGIARDGYAVVDASGAKTGFVTSGSPSPTLGRNIGLAYVPLALSAPGSEILIDVRGKALKARVVKTPFITPRVRKNKP